MLILYPSYLTRRLQLGKLGWTQERGMCLHFSNALHTLKCSYKTILLYIMFQSIVLYFGCGVAQHIHTPSTPLFGLQIQHSPSIHTKSKHGLKHEDFVTGKCFGKYVSCHVSCGAVYGFYCSILDGLMDEVVMNVDMLRVRVKLVIVSK